MVTDDTWATGYAIELDFDGDGQSDQSQPVTNPSFSFTTNGTAFGATSLHARVVETEPGTEETLTGNWQTAAIVNSSTGTGSSSSNGYGSGSGSTTWSGTSPSYGGGGSNGSGSYGSYSSGSGSGTGSTLTTGGTAGGTTGNSSPTPGTPITPRYSDSALTVSSTHGKPVKLFLPVSPPGEYASDPQTGAYTFTPYPWTVEEDLEHGTVSELSGGEWEYTPDTSYVGGDGFTLVATRPNGDIAVRVRVNATSMNSWPSGLKGSYQAVVGNDIELHAGQDSEGDTVSIQIVNGPQHGSVSASGSSVTYTPDDGYTSSDSFSYAIWDSLPSSGPGFLYASPTPATVQIGVIDPVSITNSMVLNVSLFSGSDELLLTNYGQSELPNDDPTVLNASADRETALTNATNQWNTTETNKWSQLQAFLAQEPARLAAQNDSARTSYGSALFSAAIDYAGTLFGKLSAQIDAEDAAADAWLASLTGIVGLSGTGGTSPGVDPSGSTPTPDATWTPAYTDFNNAILSAQSARQSLRDSNIGTLKSTEEDARLSYADAIETAAAGYVDSVVGVHSSF